MTPRKTWACKQLVGHNHSNCGMLIIIIIISIHIMIIIIMTSRETWARKRLVITIPIVGSLLLAFFFIFDTTNSP